jgi:trehalose 6-phosphate phosphatase
VDDERVVPFLERPESAGLFLDFDGTLSDIAHVPSEARPVPGAREVLERLAARFRLVSIVSGRSAHQLLDWLGPDVEIWGVHGAERTRGGRVELSDRVAPYSGLMDRVKQDARRRLGELGLEGVILEDKGVMLGLHFRAAREQTRARAALDELAEELARGYGLRRAGGRLAFELRPPIELSKAQVVLHRAREVTLRAVAFVGDDRVDIPGFDALDRLEEEGVATLRVAVDSTEAPPELIARADVVVDGTPGVLRFLTRLAA